MYITVDSTAYVDVRTLVGASSDSPIKIQNQSASSPVFVVENGAQPSVGVKGELVLTMEDSSTYTGKLWVRAVSDTAYIYVFVDDTVSGSTKSAPQTATLVDFAKRQATNTAFGEAVVAQNTDQINVQFQYNISNYDVKKATAGTGSVAHSQGVASLFSGTGVGSATIESRASVRYVTGHQCQAHFTEAFGNPEVNTKQRHGLFDAQNGVAVGYSGTAFGVFIYRGGVETFIPQSSFNFDKADGSGTSGFVLNPQALNIYWIAYGWLGIYPPSVSVYGGKDIGWVCLHVYDQIGTTNSPHILDPTLPVTVSIARTAGTGANIEMRTCSWRAGIVGNLPKGSLIDRAFVRVVEQKSVSANTLTPVITLKNKTTFNGLTNHVQVRYATVSLACDGTKPTTWYVYKNSTLTGAIYVDQETTESVAQYDVSATALAGGQLVGGTIMQKLGDTRINLYEGDVVLAVAPDEVITLAVKSTGATTVDAFVRWTEGF